MSLDHKNRNVRRTLIVTAPVAAAVLPRFCTKYNRTSQQMWMKLARVFCVLQVAPPSLRLPRNSRLHSPQRALCDGLGCVAVGCPTKSSFLYLFANVAFTTLEFVAY